MIARPSNNRGFAVIAAIFLMVVLAALGAYMVGISTTQQRNSALDIQGARAYQAARAGIEWGLWTVEDPENRNFAKGPGLVPCPGVETAATYTCQAACGATAALPALGGTLAGFSVSVSITCPADFPDAGVLKRLYTVTSTASFGADSSNPDFVERQLVTTVSTCRQVANGGPC